MRTRCAVTLFSVANPVNPGISQTISHYQPRYPISLARSPQLECWRMPLIPRHSKRPGDTNRLATMIVGDRRAMIRPGPREPLLHPVFSFDHQTWLQPSDHRDEACLTG